jgi:PadR family transcriptional regulator PadR
MNVESKKALEEFERWSKEVKRGAASLAILAVLEDQEAYGYEIVHQLSYRVSFLQLEQGTVYPLLRRLEERGLLNSRWDQSDPAKPKKYYSLTYDGKRALGMMMETWAVLSEEMKKLSKGVEV